MAILNIYVAISIFLLSYDNHDTESKQREIEIGVAGPIFTQKISKALWDKDINTTKDGSKILF